MTICQCICNVNNAVYKDVSELALKCPVCLRETEFCELILANLPSGWRVKVAFSFTYGHAKLESAEEAVDLRSVSVYVDICFVIFCRSLYLARILLSPE